MPTHYLAIDLGAESGRVMLGTLDSGRLALEELHRFPNTPVQTDGSLTWNIAALFDEVKTGLHQAALRRRPITSISTDSWGVDYTLFDQNGSLMSPTFHYRDARTARGVEAVKARVDWRTLFDETGIQFMPLNSIFQLAAETPGRLAGAAHLLTIADAINFLLCGVARIDESNASTSQLYNPRTKAWSQKLIHALGLPERIFPPIVSCGTTLGLLKPDISRETGLPAIQVIASCSHDTAAAVAAVPAEAPIRNPNSEIANPPWAYLSSGTWSLLGAELPSPVITDACRALNFTNEIGLGGSVRLLKNIIGLWLVQECRREWSGAGADFDYAALTELAAAAPPFVSLINPADPRFIAPGGMPRKLSDFCRETGQPEPATPGATIRCVLESLALLYRRTLRQLEQLLGNKFERLHIVGGGSRNVLLNQLTANALQIPVLAGPVEATAIGNVVVQAIALGHLPSLAEGRAVIRKCFEVTSFLPEAPAEWAPQFARFERLVGGAPKVPAS